MQKMLSVSFLYFVNARASTLYLVTISFIKCTYLFIVPCVGINARCIASPHFYPSERNTIGSWQLHSLRILLAQYTSQGLSYTLSEKSLLQRSVSELMKRVFTNRRVYTLTHNSCAAQHSQKEFLACNLPSTNLTPGLCLLKDTRSVSSIPLLENLEW